MNSFKTILKNNIKNRIRNRWDLGWKHFIVFGIDVSFNLIINVWIIKDLMEFKENLINGLLKVKYLDQLKNNS